MGRLTGLAFSVRAVREAFPVVSWVGIILPFGAQFIYSEFFCHYSLLPSFTFIFLLMMPAMIWQLRKSYIASTAASVGLFFWVVWENHIQCVSEKGPFVGGLGPLYLLVLGLFTSLVLGWFFGWLDRRFLIKKRRNESQDGSHRRQAYRTHSGHRLPRLRTEFGISATLAQLVLTRAYHCGYTLSVGALAFSTVVFSALYGVLLFDEYLPLIAWVGIALTVIAGIIAVSISTPPAADS